MNRLADLYFLLVVASFVGSNGAKTAQSSQETNDAKEEKEFFQHPGVEIDTVLRARGFRAKNFKFVSDDGYVLTITRATNPLFNGGESGLPGRDPLLFVHGTMTNANEFIVKSFGARPKDFTHLNMITISDEELEELARDPSADTLPTLAMNFGHEAWFLHRRGVRYSRERLPEHKIKKRLLYLESPQEKLAKAKRYSRRFFAQQARRLKFKGNLLEKTLITNAKRNKQFLVRSNYTEVVLVGLNKRSPTTKLKKEQASENKLGDVLKNLPEALFNATQVYQDLKQTKDSEFWNYSLDEQAAYDLPNAIDFVRLKSGSDKIALIGHSNGGALILMAHILDPKLTRKLSKTIVWSPSLILGFNDKVEAFFEPILKRAGSKPMFALTDASQGIAQLFCGLEIMQETVCEFFSNLRLGPTNGQAPHRPEFLSTDFITVSTRESAQLLQFARQKRARLFDYGEKSNLAVYGQATPPEYDPAYIVSNKVSIWSSVNDALVSFEDVEQLTSLMRTILKLYKIDHESGISFNHGSYTYHRDVARLVTIPCLLDIVNPSASLRKHQF